jgi:hypothetical protein
MFDRIMPLYEGEQYVRSNAVSELHPRDIFSTLPVAATPPA